MTGAARGTWTCSHAQSEFFQCEPAAVTNKSSISAELASFFWWCWIPATTRDSQLDFKKSNNSFKHRSGSIWPMDSISHMHWSSRWRSQGQDFYHGIPVTPGGLLAIEPRGARYQLSLSLFFSPLDSLSERLNSKWLDAVEIGVEFQIWSRTQFHCSAHTFNAEVVDWPTYGSLM